MFSCATASTTLAKGGVTVPAGISPYKYVGTACGNRTPDCQKIMNAIKASAAHPFAPTPTAVEPSPAFPRELIT